MGGGVVADSNTLSSQTLVAKPSRFFKPLIASSLALALGVSVVSADTSITIPNDPNSGWNFIWNGVDGSQAGGSNTDVYQPALNSGTDPIQTLTFQFGGSSVSGSGNATTYTATTNDTSITLNGGGKAIQMGDGTGTLNVNFSNINNTNFTLDLSNTANLTYSFVGNIATLGTNYNGSRYFKATFGASVKGNITLDSGGLTNTSNPALTFNNGAKLEGNLNVNFEDTGIVFNGEGGAITGKVSKTSTGGLTINFDDTHGGSIEDGITISGGNTNTNININNLTTITGAISLSSSTNAFNFIGDSKTITGDINLSGGTTTINNLSTMTGNINASNGGTIIFGTNTQVDGNIDTYRSDYVDYTTTIKGLGSINNITTTGNADYVRTRFSKIIFGNDAKVYGTIRAKNYAVNHLVFTQASTLKAKNNNGIEILANQTVSGLGSFSKNILIFSGNTTAKISTLSASGDYSYGVLAEHTFNALNYNANATNSTEIASITSSRGYNLIGKDLVTYTASGETITYNANIFQDHGDYKKQIKDTALSEFVKTSHSASGTFVFGVDNTSNAINTTGSGKNYININGITTIKGNIFTLDKVSNLTVENHNNLLVLTGTSATLGENSNTISIKVDNGGNVANHRNSTNTLLLGATTNTLNLTELSALGTWGATPAKNFNAISINSGATTANITTISSDYGNNIIGKDLITQASGYDTTLFTGANNAVMNTTNFASTFMSSTYTATGTYTFGSVTAGNGGNYINVENLTITGAITANGGNNYIHTSGTSSLASITTGNNTNQIMLNGSINSISGNITTSNSGTNTISSTQDLQISKSGELQISAQWGKNSISAQTITLGNESNKVSLGVSGDSATQEAKNSITASGALTAHFSTISTAGTISNTTNGKHTNEISGGAGSSISIESMSANSNQSNNTALNSNTITLTGAGNISVSENISAGHGSNTFVFSADNSTFSMGASNSKLTLNGNGNNTFNIQGNTKITSDITAEKTAGSGKNIFKISNTKSLTFANSDDSSATTLTTNSGATEINFLGDSGGSTGTFSGNVSTTGGSTTFVFTNDGGTYSLANGNTLSTSGAGQNIIDLSNKSATISNDLKFSGIGEISSGAGNIIKIGANKTLTLNSGNGNINTSSGATTLNFNGANAGLSGNVSTSGGTTAINFNDTSSITGTLTTSSTGTTNIAITNGKSGSISGAVTAGGEAMNIDFLAGSEATTLTLGSSGNGTLSTTAGTTSINFNGSNGVLSGLVDTNGSNAITTIAIADNSGGTISGAVSTNTTNGTTNISFANGENAKSLTLSASGNTLTNITFGDNDSTNNTINLGSGKTEFFDAVSVGGGNTTQALAFSLSDDTELALTKGLTTGNNGATTLSVVADATNGVVLSGGSVELTSLNMALGTTSASTLTFKNTSTTIDTFTSNVSDSVVNKLVMGEGSSSVSVGSTASRTKFDLDFSDTSNTAKTFTLEKGENTIKQLTVSDTGANTLAIKAGSTTINSVSDLSGKDFTLALSSDTQTPSNTLVRLDSAISGVKATFKGGTSLADQVHFSELLLAGNGTNTLSSVTTSASNAKITLESISNAEISSLAFNDNGSMLLGFSGTGDSTLALGGSVVVGDRQTLGISIGGSGTRALKVDGNITFNQGSTLVIDFQKTQASTDKITATLGAQGQKFTIGDNSNSIINLRGGAGTSTLNGSIELTGGTNTINFIDTATMGDVIKLTNGSNIINVYAGEDESNMIVGTMAVSDVGGVNNTINLGNFSKLNLTDSHNTAGAGELKTTATNILNFNGSNAVLQGGFGVGNDGTTGTATINVKNIGAVITGNVTNASVSFSEIDDSTLTLKGATNTISSLGATDVTGSKLVLDSTSNQVETTLASSITRDGVGLKFGVGSNAKKFIFQEADNILSGIELDTNASTNNTLALNKGKTTFKNAMVVGASQGITFELANNTELSLDDGMSGAGDSVLKVAENGSATLSGGAITLKTAHLSGDDSTLTLSAQNTNITTLNANATTSNTLELDSSSNNVIATIGTISNTNNNLTLAFKGNETYSNTLNLENKTLQNIKVISGVNNKIAFSGNNNTITQALVTNGSGITFQVNDNAKLSITEALDNSSGGNISLDLQNNSELTLHKSSTINSLSANNATIDIHNMDSNPLTRGSGNQLVIGNNGGSYKGVASFVVDVGASGVTDSVVFKNVTKQDNGSKSEAIIKVLGTYDDIINRATDTLVAKVIDSGYNPEDGSTANMEVIGGKSLVGGTVVEVLELNQQVTFDSINYYIGAIKDEGAPIQYQEVASSALTVNYDLYLANFNSLNKRMGELRESEHNQGVWARVFGGNMSNDFGAGSKTDYLTAQAGYDYSLSIGESARNFMGIAVAYGTSDTKGNTLSMNGLVGASDSISLDKVNSNMIEVGLYNSYVADSGWYNDTILKFDYIMSEFSLSNDPNTMSNTSNFAMVLSDEFGYRYKFAESEKGSWYIDPQVEVAFGYFNQSDFNREMYNMVGTSTTMQATQDSILTLRTRAGASLGKKFTTEKGFASLYVGAFYEYDYINGGSASMQGEVGGTTTTLDSIESNGRAVLNIGSNIELTKGARMYIDVEKSFGDKQRTFMQFNLGARYSF
ncbi:hypothetical protein [Helicobacter brantae]|uniref:Autotransporter domain-containing protein n=1 Tax=Helicobacter brantae TaxID=375927 RepID=A0A3D8J1N3_9HELI|nr:hypothetical protein [Helicobacter brantae]RDU71116.1 hypothetical protein CQA58_03110 [Helicobacter brantae]